MCADASAHILLYCGSCFYELSEYYFPAGFTVAEYVELAINRAAYPLSLKVVPFTGQRFPRDIYVVDTCCAAVDLESGCNGLYLSVAVFTGKGDAQIAECLFAVEITYCGDVGFGCAAEAGNDFAFLEVFQVKILPLA